LLKFHIPVPTFGGYLAEPLKVSSVEEGDEEKVDEGEGDETDRILEAEVLKTGEMIGPITAMHVQVRVVLKPFLVKSDRAALRSRRDACNEW
jgi:hypothetical protein